MKYSFYIKCSDLAQQCYGSLSAAMAAVRASFSSGTTAQLFEVLPQRTTITFFCGNNDISDLPATNGILEVIKGASDANFRFIIFHGVDGSLWHYKYHSITVAQNGWNRITQNADFGIIRVEVAVATANSRTEITQMSPRGRYWIPVVDGHSTSIVSRPEVTYDGGKWYIFADVAQTYFVSFYKYPVTL